MSRCFTMLCRDVLTEHGPVSSVLIGVITGARHLELPLALSADVRCKALIKSSKRQLQYPSTACACVARQAGCVGQ